MNECRYLGIMFGGRATQYDVQSKQARQTHLLTTKYHNTNKNKERSTHTQAQALLQ